MWIEDINLIIKRLNGLSLVLTQAGSYLRQTNMAASVYAEYYKKTWAELIKKQDWFPLQECTDRSVLTTYTMSCDQVRGQSEAATRLLRLWGFLDSEDVWYKLVSYAFNVEDVIDVPGWLHRLSESNGLPGTPCAFMYTACLGGVHLVLVI